MLAFSFNNNCYTWWNANKWVIMHRPNSFVCGGTYLPYVLLAMPCIRLFAISTMFWCQVLLWLLVNLVCYLIFVTKWCGAIRWSVVHIYDKVIPFSIIVILIESLTCFILCPWHAKSCRQRLVIFTLNDRQETSCMLSFCLTLMTPFCFALVNVWRTLYEFLLWTSDICYLPCLSPIGQRPIGHIYIFYIGRG